MKNTGKKFLSDIKLHSDYLKWKDNLGRYETWGEACESILDGHRAHYKVDIEEELSSALESMKDMKVFASQRNLQFRGPQIQRSNARIFNCSVVHAVTNKVFQNVMFLLMNGCGVGVSLLKPFVENISGIQKRTLGAKTFVIQDSIEGWSDAVGVLLSSYFIDKQPFQDYAGYEVRFDYSMIRPKGSYISGGYKAPGPDELKKSLEKIESFIESLLQSKNKLSARDVYDIICMSSDAVISGGVRRSALIMLVDPNDEEMILAKTGNWRQDTPWRARSNNSVMLKRGEAKKEFFEYLLSLNGGDNDIGFVFVDSWFELVNPCAEIGFTPINIEGVDLCSISYENLKDFTSKNEDRFGVQFCNLTSMNAEKMVSEEVFLRSCRDAAILGTLQAGYTSFPYLGKTTEAITRREALLGVSMTGWMNNPKMFNAELLRKGAQVVKDTNEKLAQKLGINPAARTTCVKPEGNLSVIAGTSSGIHPEHSEQYFRIMQLNKETEVAKYLSQNMPFLLEESVWSAFKTDYVVFIPVKNPKEGLFKKDVKGVKHLELVKLVQENWVIEGTRPERGISNKTRHNVSSTIIIDDKNAMNDYLWDNQHIFSGVSFISDFGDKDFNQAPFTSVLSAEEVFEQYGKGALFASGLIVDGLHYFDGNLWQACDCALDKTIPVVGTREQVLLKKSWLDRAKKFAKNYFKGDMKKMVYCLKDVHLSHKWETINRQMKDVDFSKILPKPEYVSPDKYAGLACSSGACEITRI
jgi:ribonucleoside-diphosphate reductase alpha chain